MKQFLYFCLSLVIILSCAKPEKKVIIAHRGASGYLPEHTLEAKAMAYAMTPDYIEQDVVLTKDDRAIVIHDMHLDTVTNVAEIFPKKKRDDGRYYAIDLTLEEIKKLTVFERIDLTTKKQVYPKRFPSDKKIPFKISTLEEEIELIQGLNHSTGKNIGIYTELKSPRFHKDEKKDIARITIEILNKYGYKDKKSNCYVQCFDPDCLKYIKNDLKSELKLIQLIAVNEWNETPGVDYTKMLTEEGVKQIATYAEGAGPWLNQIIIESGSSYRVSPFMTYAKKYNLQVHPYTYRVDDLPQFVANKYEYLDIILYRANADGLFTDFPDVAIEFLKKTGGK